MDINISKIMMVGRVTTERVLESYVINISLKLFLNVVQHVPLRQSDEDKILGGFSQRNSTIL